MQWYQPDHMQTICASLQTENHTTPHHSIFYRPDALPDSQTTVSKHLRHINADVNNKKEKDNYFFSHSVHLMYSATSISLFLKFWKIYNPVQVNLR